MSFFLFRRPTVMKNAARFLSSPLVAPPPPPPPPVPYRGRATQLQQPPPRRGFVSASRSAAAAAAAAWRLRPTHPTRPQPLVGWQQHAQQQQQHLLQQQHLQCCRRWKHTVKTNQSVTKRIRQRGDGSLKRMKSGKSHNTGYKARSRCNRLGQSTTIQEPKMEKKLRRVLY